MCSRAQAQLEMTSKDRVPDYCIFQFQLDAQLLILSILQRFLHFQLNGLIWEHLIPLQISKIHFVYNLY